MGIAENIAQVRQDSTSRPAQAAPREITLVAVSKTVGLETVAEAMAQGLTHFGETGLMSSIGSKSISRRLWHMIVRLQTNKVKQVVSWRC